jgi:colicin import membrane protein
MNAMALSAGKVTNSIGSSGQLKIADWMQSAIVHGLLVLALFISVQWKTKAPESAPVQVEIFNPPAAQVAIAVPPPVPVPVPRPVEVKPLPKVIETPVVPKVDIAVEKKKIEPKPIAKAESKPEPKPEPKTETKPKLDLKKLEEELEAKESKASEKTREDALKKIIASASTGGNTSDKSADKAGSAGSYVDASYISRLKNMIRSNTVFQTPENMNGNPRAEFIVTLMPDCSVAGVRLKKSSGLKIWDDAAERALSRTTNFPRPPSGACVPSMEITHAPKD